MKYTLSLLIIGAMLCASNVNAQQKADSLKQAHAKHLSKELSISESSAMQVASTMEKYKDAAKKLVTDTTLTEEQIRAKLDALIADKNKKLSLLLTEEQYQKFVPSSERQQK